MATISETTGRAVGRTETDAAVTGGVGFDAVMAALCGWLIAGLFLDGWAHTHLTVLDTFFTPWHAVFYSGALAVAAFLGGSLLIQRLQGRTWTRALPPGYPLSLLGLGIFALSGVGDLTWHTVFGIERNFATLLSPTHLGLAAGIGLIVSGPLRAAWARPDARARLGWAAAVPLLLALTYLLSLLTFMTEYAQPFVAPYALSYSAGGQGQEVGVLGVILQSALLVGLLLLVVRRWVLPFGALTLVFTLNAALLAVIGNVYPLVLVAALAGLAADILGGWLRPAQAGPAASRIFAVAVPAVLYVIYFGVLGLVSPLTWPPAIWVGAIVEAAGTGWLISYLVVPPAGAAGAH